MNELIDPRKAFGEAVIEAAQKNPDVVVLSADSSSGSGLANFPNLFPERHFEFGIMEQGVIGYASGMATTGKIPVFAAIAVASLLTASLSFICKKFWVFRTASV